MLVRSKRSNSFSMSPASTITAFNQLGGSETFSLALGNGQNFFTLTADAA